MGRDLVGVVARFQHAMAGHDDHEGIAPDRLRHRMGRARRTQSARDLGIGAGLAARDAAGELVDALVEIGNAGHVERDFADVGVAAAQDRDDALDGDFGCSRAGAARALPDRAGTSGGGFPARAPRAIARPKCPARPMRFRTGRPPSQRSCTRTQTFYATLPGGDHNTVIKARIWNLAVRLRAGRRGEGGTGLAAEAGSANHEASTIRNRRVAVPGRLGPQAHRGRSSMVERQLPKLHTRVRFPSPAPVSTDVCGAR